MRKLLLLLALGLLLLNCNSSAIEKPKDLLSKDQMVDILYDLYVVNAIKTTDMLYLVDRNVTPAKYILHKYKVDSVQFSQSDRYYASDVEEYEKIYQRVTEKLQVNKAALDSLISKNPIKVSEKDTTKRVLILPNKQKFKKGLLLKDSVRN